MKKPRPWQTFIEYGCSLREGMGLLLLLTILVMIPFIIYELNSCNATNTTANSLPQYPRKEWRRNQCPLSQCDENKCYYPTRFDWTYPCLVSQILKELPNHVPPHEDTKIALSMMSEFAHKGNVSNCWICQHLPSSSKAPMLAPVPFTEADWSIMGLPAISHQVQPAMRDVTLFLLS